MKKIILITTLLLTLTLGSVVAYASTPVGEAYKMFPKAWSGEYCVMYERSNAQNFEYWMLVSDTEFIYNGNNDFRMKGSYILYTFQNGIWVKTSTGNGDLRGFDTLYYSTFSIKDSGGTTFFHKTLPKMSFSELVAEVNLEGILQTIVGLIPCLVVLVISLVGFRKAWSMLRQVLSQA